MLRVFPCCVYCSRFQCKFKHRRGPIVRSSRGGYNPRQSVNRGMETVGQAMTGPSTDTLPPRLLDALASLNRIGAAISRMGADEAVDVAATLRLIVESAVTVVPGSSAVIYAYDEERGAFDNATRVAAGQQAHPLPGDDPRPDGMGARAVRERRRILSYEADGVDIHPVKRQAGARAVACFPLVVAERPLGVLYVYLHEERRFTELELLMLENFVNQAAIAMYHARRLADMQRDLERKKDELSRLRRAGLLISSRLRLQDTLEAILQMALEVTGARYGILRLVDERGENLVTRALAGERLSRPAVESLPINTTSITGWVAKHRRPLCIPDVRKSPWSRIYYPLDHDLEMRSELAVPLIGANGRLEGVVNLESPHVAAFTEADSHLLQALATQAVIAIQEARLLDALLEMAWRVLAEPLDRVFSRLVDRARELLNVTAAAIWTLEGDTLVLRAGNGNQPTGDRIPVGQSLTGEAVRVRGPVISEDVRSDPRFFRPELARAHGWVTALVVPLLVGDEEEPVGAFTVYWGEKEGGMATGAGLRGDEGAPHLPDVPLVSDWDKKVLTLLAHYAALAVHNARRQEALQAAQEQRAVAETFAALGDIAANVLHHLNNKVGTIPVRVQGIQDKCEGVLAEHPYLAHNLAAIEESAREALDAVRESLSLLHPIHRVPVNVRACVENALRTVAPPAGVAVSLEGVDTLPSVMAGQQTLTLVFVNLLQNAVEAMGGRGQITVRGWLEDGHVHVAVADTGPGIPPELHDRIFDFNYSRQEGRRDHKLGFGLWWVKTLMVRLGGSVRVESDGQSGTTFVLRLPPA